MCYVFVESLLHVQEESALTVFNFQIFLLCCQGLRQANVALGHEFPVVRELAELLVVLFVEVFAEEVSVHLVRSEPLDCTVDKTVVLTQVFHIIFIFAE